MLFPAPQPLDLRLSWSQLSKTRLGIGPLGKFLIPNSKSQCVVSGPRPSRATPRLTSHFVNILTSSHTRNWVHPKNHLAPPLGCCFCMNRAPESISCPGTYTSPPKNHFCAVSAVYVLQPPGHRHSCWALPWLLGHPKQDVPFVPVKGSSCPILVFAPIIQDPFGL